MADYKDKVVVIIGAGAGIGQGMARRFASLGAKLALADVNPESLAFTEKELRDQGVKIISNCFDVRDYAAMEAFAQQIFANYGTVDYFINNAGIASVGNIWKLPLEEWHTVFDVNVMGIVHGIKAFIPLMLAQDKECFFINTSSNAGLQAPGVLPAYCMSKHAAVSVTESLAIQLQMVQSKIKAFVFCPGFIVTELYENSTNSGKKDPYYESEEYKWYDAILYNGVKNGMEMEKAMDGFIKGLEEDKFYIRTHPNEEKDVKYRTDIVLNCTRPVPIPMR